MEVRTLGRVSYREAWSLQRELAARIAAGDLPEQLLLLEHPHTYTLGRSGGLNHLLASPEELAALGAEVVGSDRGGDITYHGPGQLVGYPLLNLRRMGGDVHVYLRTIEQALIETLAEYGLTGEREKEYTGVWVQGAKVAAIGVKVSRSVTMHGFALNVSTDMAYFDHIVACGIQGRRATSMEELLDGGPVPGADLLDGVQRGFESAFGVALRPAAHVATAELSARGETRQAAR